MTCLLLCVWIRLQHGTFSREMYKLWMRSRFKQTHSLFPYSSCTFFSIYFHGFQMYMLSCHIHTWVLLSTSVTATSPSLAISWEAAKDPKKNQTKVVLISSLTSRFKCNYWTLGGKKYISQYIHLHQDKKIENKTMTHSDIGSYDKRP